MKQYKLSKGFAKFLTSVLISISVFATFSGFAELPVWDFLVIYIKPILGSITIGGVIAMGINYLKVKYLT